MIEQTCVVGPFQCNCRIWVCPETGKGVVIDPGDEPSRILSSIQGLKTPSGKPVQIEYLLHTHAHLDHIGATRSVSESHPLARIALHRADEPLYQQLKTQGALFGFSYDEPLPIQHYLEEGQELKVGHMKLTVIHTPGHSPGSVSIRLHEDSVHGMRESVLTGDTLFSGSVGRTDLWGADSEEMFRSLYDRLLRLDEDTRVCPGHGPDTRIGIEKRQNPFLKR
jgi:hydroxyacylglutathione hydrolase